MCEPSTRELNNKRGELAKQKTREIETGLSGEQEVPLAIQLLVLRFTYTLPTPLNLFRQFGISDSYKTSKRLYLTSFLHVLRNHKVLVKS